MHSWGRRVLPCALGVIGFVCPFGLEVVGFVWASPCAVHFLGSRSCAFRTRRFSRSELVRVSFLVDRFRRTLPCALGAVVYFPRAPCGTSGYVRSIHVRSRVFVCPLSGSLWGFGPFLWVVRVLFLWVRLLHSWGSSVSFGLFWSIPKGLRMGRSGHSRAPLLTFGCITVRHGDLSFPWR